MKLVCCFGFKNEVKWVKSMKFGAGNEVPAHMGEAMSGAEGAHMCWLASLRAHVREEGGAQGPTSPLCSQHQLTF